MRKKEMEHEVMTFEVQGRTHFLPRKSTEAKTLTVYCDNMILIKKTLIIREDVRRISVVTCYIDVVLQFNICSNLCFFTQ